MEYKSLSKKELVDILENFQKILNNRPVHSSLNSENSSMRKSDLEDLIGTIPFLLLNQDIFEKNQDIADFAQKLNILIPSPEKKKREDIIGRVVSAIAKFDNASIADLNVGIKSLKKSDIKKGKTSFFKDWENAIKEMNIS